MTQSNAGQRRMARKAIISGSPFHAAFVDAHDRSTASSRRAKRVAKKQVRTREARAAQRDEF